MLVYAADADSPFHAGCRDWDAHTAVLMREHGIRCIVTRDTDFHRFPFLESVDPLTEGGSPPSA